MKKNNWRFIYNRENDPYFNMAVDEALLNSVKEGSPPVLRVYEWISPAISIGYFQSAEKTVNLDRCRKAGITLVRRITGGRAVLHNQTEEITYSFCASSKSFTQLGKNVSETYQKLSSALLFSLRSLGIAAQWVKPTKGKVIKNISYSKKEDEVKKVGTLQPAPTLYNLPCFSSLSRYEISFEGKKLIGSAQRRFGDYFLQHGSIIVNKGKFKLTQFLPERFSSEKKRLEKGSTSLEEIKGDKVENFEVACSLLQGFKTFFQTDLNEDILSAEELKDARRLTEEKYSKNIWNLRY